jgi:hypothetical protein
MRRRKNRQSQQRERLWHASLRAEDEAVAYLHKFDPAVALATACSVEQILAIKWEAEQEEMRRRRDPRKVMCIRSTRLRELDVALARLPQGVHPDAIMLRGAPGSDWAFRADRPDRLAASADHRYQKNWLSPYVFCSESFKADGIRNAADRPGF